MCKAICRRWSRPRSPPQCRLLADQSVDIGTAAAEITRAEERDDPAVVKVVGTPVAPERLHALYFTRATAPYGDGPLYHHIGLYAFRRAALERFVALPPSPLEHGKSSSNCGRSKPVCASTSRSWTRLPSASIRRTIWRARAPCYRVAHEATKKNRIPGRARRQFAHRLRRGLSGLRSRCPVRPSRMPLPRCAPAGRSFGMIPIDNSVAGRVADIHHLMPRSGLHIVGEWFLPVQHQLMAPQRRYAPTIKTVESHVHALGQCRNIIRKLRIKAVVAADTAGAAREVAEARRHFARCAGDQARREDLRPANPQKRRRRRQAQHHPLRRARAQAEMGEPQGAARGHHVRVRGAQYPGRAVQGPGRLCHQRRQHDQARELHGRRQLLPRPSSTPMCRGIRRTADWNWRSKSWSSCLGRSR